MTISDPLEVLAEDDCLALLRCRKVGRISFEFEGNIEIFPVTYGMEGKIIVFRTGPGTKLHAMPETMVAFEVDGWDPDPRIGWSVVAKGPAEEITLNPGRAAEHLRRVPLDPSAPGERWRWIAIKPSEITGRRFHAPSAKGERS
ncbi:MAG TPA: pyridoxamine 5'-phosphate oxidase family protein [Candidatus Limnocylindria bacterium]|jgi:nitroimidazol reductase NimA-like FMN-containing flavoprotein (pyridoxamine 5'-phosphate oxidase superfamily)